MGPVDRAHGYTLGGVIENGRSNHTGAMGGGICSVSTTMFNAAARAGLEIDERHPHFYYIDRYPIGLDATVYSSGGQTWDLKWTNDTPNPIVIRGYTTYGSRSTITFQLWSLPLDRKVTFSPAYKANVVRAVDRTEYVTTLKPGQENRAEYPTAGFYYVQDPHRDRLDRQGDPSRHVGFSLRQGRRAAADRACEDSKADPDARTRTGARRPHAGHAGPGSEPDARPSAPQDPVATTADGPERSPGHRQRIGGLNYAEATQIGGRA